MRHKELHADVKTIELITNTVPDLPQHGKVPLSP